MEKKFSLVPYGWQDFGNGYLETKSPMEQVVHDMRLYDAKCKGVIYDPHCNKWFDAVADEHYDMAYDIEVDGTLLASYYASLHYPPEEVFQNSMFPDEEIWRFNTYSHEEKINFTLQCARKKGCVTRTICELLTTVDPNEFWKHYASVRETDGYAVQPMPIGGKVVE